MFSRRDVLRSSAGAALAMPMLPTMVMGQTDNYPSRDIHSMCAYPPGSGGDLISRYFSKRLADLTGRNVIVENRVGAGGNIATEAVARSKPDGYMNFITTGASVIAGAPHLFKKLPFDPINDLEHITTLARVPFVFFVAADSPYKTLADLTADLKKRGDKASYGSVANIGILAAELYKAEFGLQTVEVKYRDPGLYFNDVINGALAFALISPPLAAAQEKAGKVRILATTAKDRFQALPNMPSAAEAGMKTVDLVDFMSVHVPKGTPQPICQKLETLFNQIVAEPETKPFLAQAGMDPYPGNMKMMRELIDTTYKQWGEAVKVAKLEPA